ncbi:MAG TPA: apolipoprotein N-acyltransferase [Polyangiaceae bacterium LLY-WYZ-14_1]|nr:apolipoprotein N-acyltransferase [Polyangiaceae bacterium LLY-WYZ-14_1]
MSETSSPPAAPSRRVRLLRTALCVASGCLSFLGFSGFGLWPLAFVAFIPMMVALDLEPRPTNRAAIGLGLWFGFAAMAGGYHWLVDTIEVFGGFGKALSIAFAAVLFLYQAGLFGLFAWLWYRARGNGFPATIAAIPALATAELVYPMLFPYYYGASFHRLPVLMQVADLGGPLLVSAIATAVNGALYELGRARLRGEPLPRIGPAVGLGALLFALGYGAYRIAEVDARVATAETLDVAMVQASMGIAEKRADPREGLRRHLRASVDAQSDPDRGPPDLVVWPESGYSWFIPEDEVDLSLRYGLDPVETALLFGGLSRREHRGEPRAFNTAFLIDPDKRVLGTYDKTYLLAFGEYIPFGDELPVLYEISPNSGRFVPGSHVRPVVLDGVRMTVLICYEDILPAFVRGAVRTGSPDLLVNLTNDAWFGDTQEPWIHLALAKLRSVEHHRAMVRSTNSGVSAFIDPVGRVIDHSGVFTQETLRAEVPLLDDDTVYTALGNWPGWMSMGAVFWMAFLGRHPLRRRPAGGDQHARDQAV